MINEQWLFAKQVDHQYLKLKTIIIYFRFFLLLSVSSVSSLFSLEELNTFIWSFKLMTQRTQSLFIFQCERQSVCAHSCIKYILHLTWKVY